ncbi:outer membrane protein assembly factor BamA [Pelagibacterales bacterium SAG-MED28]|nr:outer membrane protein assembly factor BamA [Pelagibacterales bacterium SAG-MED28]|tara:strand:+ start:563 stop:2794 length:2232 start_codon:yes stop_codon:yes gene_type:complete
MYKYFFILLFIFFSISSTKAENIDKVSITGNKRLSSETIKIYGDIEVNKNYSDFDTNEILRKLYETELFENVKIKIAGNELLIDVKEYPFIDQLVIIGEKSKNLREQIIKNIKSKEKRSFIKSNLKSDIEIIKTLYSSRGYNSTNVEMKTKKVSENSFDLLIEIERGDKTKISSIKFIGNKKISSRKLRDVIASEEDKFWKIISNNTNFNKNLLELDTRLLRNFYKSTGFYDVRINSKVAKINDNDQAELTYIISEGTRYTINKISTNVDKVFDAEIFFPLNQIYKKYIGDYYSPFKVKKLLEDLDDLIDKNNLQFVEHNVQEEITKNSINIVLNIYEGKKISVERINISGNSVTNENVIRGELLLDEGEPFSKLNLDRSIAEIKSRRIFKNVDYKVIDGSKNDLKIINIEVEEQPTGEITAGAGVGTDGGLFALGVKENNWLGTGKSVAFDIEIDSESFTGVLNYMDPNYDFLGNSLSYSLASETNDKPDQGYENSLTSFGLATSFEQYKDIFVSLGLNADYDDLRTNSTASSALKKQEGSYSDISGNYGFSFDTRDRSFMPTKGSIIKLGQTLPLYADSASISNFLSASKYKTINENVVGVGKIYLSTINGIGSDDVRLSKRKNLSTRRLRGFEKNKIGPVDNKDYIGGNYVAALNFEANLPNILPDDTNTDVNLFFDLGNVWGVDYDSSIDDSNKIRSSTGIIANWMSPIGPMNFVLSQNLSKASTDKTQGFSFNLGTTF